ncbi:MAG: bifunctional riboflavin kinase/FAD synthetase [Limisphaerales bacterium]
MQVVSSPKELLRSSQPVHIAIGMFDGVHLGHQQLLQLALNNANRNHGLAAALTFDQHPNHVVAPHRIPPSIQNLQSRLQTLKTTGIHAAIVTPFTHAFSQIHGETFVRQIAQDLHPLSSICIGQGFTFGHQRSGTCQLLKNLESELHYTTHILPPVSLNSCPVRSTIIREKIAAGLLTEASSLLGRPYSIAGEIIQGDQLGRQIGFPTANLNVQNLALPPLGVYSANAILNDKSYPAVLNLGIRPTLNQTTPSLRLETHILDFQQDIYGAYLEVQPLQFLRGEKKFASLESLRLQIQSDLQQARNLLAPLP